MTFALCRKHETQRVRRKPGLDLSNSNIARKSRKQRNMTSANLSIICVDNRRQIFNGDQGHVAIDAARPMDL